MGVTTQLLLALLLVAVVTGDHEGQVLQRLMEWPSLDHLSRSRRDILSMASAGLKLMSIDGNFNSTCLTDIMAVWKALQVPKMWAIKMLDAFGKPGSGILRGNTRWVGSHTICRSVVVENNENETTLQFEPKYFWITFQLVNLPVASDNDSAQRTFHIAACLPSTCPTEELLQILQIAPDVIQVPLLTQHINFTGVEAIQENDDFWGDNWAVFGLWAWGGVVFIIMFGSMLDFQFCSLSGPSAEEETDADRKDAATPTDDAAIENGTATLTAVDNDKAAIEDAGVFKSMVFAFSLPRNFYKIASCDEGDYTLPSTNAIRVISMVWSVVAYTFIDCVPTLDNALDFIEETKRYRFYFIYHHAMAIDSFLVVSGASLVYMFLKKTDEKGKLTRTKLILFRILRIAVPYWLILILVDTTVGLYSGNGPYWSYVNEATEHCRRDWWLNMAFINNFFVSNAEQCMSHGFYMDLEMQFLLVGVVILFALSNMAWVGLLISVVLYVASIVTTATIAYTNDFPSMLDLETQGPGTHVYESLMEKLQVMPYNRSPCYLIGIGLGWYLYSVDCKAEMHKAFAIVGWIVSLSCFPLVIFGSVMLDGRGTAAAAFYYTSIHTVWSLGVAWVIFATATGHAGFISQILTLPHWNPFSRVVYCTFIYHVGYISSLWLGTDNSRHFSFLMMVSYSLSNVVVTFAGGLILSLLFESPIIRIESYFSRTNLYKRLTI